jgi:RNA polymerase sigma-70 factor (ECF subfamily)
MIRARLRIKRETIQSSGSWRSMSLSSAIGSPTPMVVEATHAFEILYVRYWQNIVDFLRQRCPYLDQHATEDIANESFLRLWETRSHILIQGTVLSYLKAIARNKAVDHYRHCVHHAREEIPGDAMSSMPSPDTVAEQKEFATAVSQALASLPPSRRLAFELYQEGLSARDIALCIGRTETAARRLVQKARNSLGKMEFTNGDCGSSGKGRRRQGGKDRS